MELLIPTSLPFPISKPSLFSPFSPKPSFNGGFSRRINFYRKLNRISIVPLRISLSSEHDSSSNHGCLNEESRADFDVSWGGGEDSKFVEVVGIGSRNDAVLDFCLESPFKSSLSSLRFWNILLKDSKEVQLQQRSLRKDMIPRIVEVPSSLLSSPRAVILVATAGYGLDHTIAIELLKAVKSTNGLAVGLILKPFSFEGQRRQDEVRDLVNKIREHTNFFIVVDTDALLQKEVVTLAEALKSANSAILVAINSICILMSEEYKKFLDHSHNKVKEVTVPEVRKILESYGGAKVGFGAGNDMKSSIARAVFDCPFIGGGIKDLNGIVVCTVASADVTDNSDPHPFLHIFRQITGCKKEILASVLHEPNLEPNLIVTTIIVIGISEQNVPQRKGFLSGLALRFPFVFSLLRRDHTESEDPIPAHSLRNPYPSEVMSSSDGGNMLNLNSVDVTNGSHDLDSEELQTLLGSSYDEIHASSSEVKKSEIGINNSASNVYDRTFEGGPVFQRETLNCWNVGPGFDVAQEWAKERASISGVSPVLNDQPFYNLPVGVKLSEISTDSTEFTNTPQPSEPRTSDDPSAESLGTKTMPSWDALTDAGFEAAIDIYNAASTLLKGKYADAPRKQGLLSVRASSMLEAERDSHKKWSPIMEMQYRGGIYKGRCQGGLPEGKGCLTLVDGSIYDGMWRYGKRSGLGTFYYSNGDVFQGSWRDDLMHGKGWFYFHTGDRWFANFWKGKANGEGRFYSKDGKIFFGHFQDGWRHGSSLFIDIDGTRWAEIWDEGVLLSREQLEF